MLPTSPSPEEGLSLDTPVTIGQIQTVLRADVRQLTAEMLRMTCELSSFGSRLRENLDALVALQRAVVNLGASLGF